MDDWNRSNALPDLLGAVWHLPFGSWGDEMENIEHPDITAAMRTGYPSWDNPYLMAKCDELLDYIEDEKWGDRIPGGWNG